MEYSKMNFNSIDKNKLNKILEQMKNYLNKKNIKTFLPYKRTFYNFLKYLDNINIKFENISQKEIKNYLKISTKNRGHKFAIISVFLIKDGYLSYDDYNKFNSDNKFLISNYKKDFLKYLKTKGRKESTLIKINNNLNRLFNFLNEKNKLYIKDITRDILEQYMFYFFNLISKITGNKIANSTLIRNILSVKMYFRFLLKENYIKYNPAQLLKTPKYEQKISLNYFTQKQIKDFFRKIEIKNPKTYRIKLLFEILYNFGLRITEALNIKISDIDFENETLLVRISKTDEIRYVPMNKYIKEYLKLYIKNIHNKYFVNEENYLFFNKDKNNILTKTHTNDLLKIVPKEMGIKTNISTHAFRRSIGKHLLENGLSIRYVQKFLGHKCIDSTKYYTVLNMEDLRKAIKKYHPREIEKEKYLKQTRYKNEICRTIS